MTEYTRPGRRTPNPSHIREVKKHLFWDSDIHEWFYDGKRLRNHGGEWDRWGGCKFINPLCPSDLCRLPKDHVGSEYNIHLLGTSGEPELIPCMERHPNKSATFNDLIAMGWKRQREMFDD